MLPICAAAMAALYAFSIPVYIAARAALCGGEGTLSAGVSAFAPPILRAVPKGKPKKRAPRLSAGTYFAFARRVLPRIRVVSIRAEGTVCTGSAMTTALICGGTEIICASLRACGVRRAHIHLSPDFSDGETSIALQGIISIRTGQIIVAAALCAAERIKGRFFKWKDR